MLHTEFRLLLTSVTLNGLERRNDRRRALFMG